MDNKLQIFQWKADVHQVFWSKMLERHFLGVNVSGFVFNKALWKICHQPSWVSFLIRHLMLKIPLKVAMGNIQSFKLLEWAGQLHTLACFSSEPQYNILKCDFCISVLNRDHSFWARNHSRNNFQIWKLQYFTWYQRQA